MKNIFSIEYCISEIRKMKFPNYLHCGDVTIEWKNFNTTGGDLPGYIHHNSKIDKECSIPVFKIHGNVWMSMTPMEMASHWIPIQKARGVVGVGGIGLGYYIQRIMKLKRVKKIIAYEDNASVIAAFKEVNKNLPGFEKVEIRKKDFLTITGNFDFIYNDIYASPDAEEVAEHSERILSQVNTKDYWYWTLELNLYDKLCEGGMSAALMVANDYHLKRFFTMWLDYTGFTRMVWPEHLDHLNKRCFFDDKFNQDLTDKKFIFDENKRIKL